MPFILLFQVYIDSLTEADLQFIMTSLFPALPRNLISCMVKFNSRLVRETGELRLWGQRGAPWELNLRDLFRWCEAIMADSGRCTTSDKDVTFHPGKFVDLIYVDRMRTKEDKEKVNMVIRSVVLLVSCIMSFFIGQGNTQLCCEGMCKYDYAQS
jgi:midasin